MTITPNANQVTAQTIVLAHLKHAPIGKREIDMNLLSDTRKVLSGENVVK